MYLIWLRVLVRLIERRRNFVCICSPDEIRRVLSAIVDFLISDITDISTYRRMKCLVSSVQLTLVLRSIKRSITTDNVLLSKITSWRMLGAYNLKCEELDATLREFYQDIRSELEPDAFGKLLISLIEQKKLLDSGSTTDLSNFFLRYFRI